MRRFILLSLIALPLFAADGTVNGTLNISGKKTPLKYVLARTTPNPFDKKKTDVVLLLTDVAIAPADFEGDFGRMKLASDGKLNGVELEIEPENKQIISGTIYSSSLQHGGGQVSMTGMHELETTTFTATQIAGKVSMPSHEFAGSTFQYTATFSAPIAGKAAPAPPAALKGKPLPAGGGDPGKAYDSYRATLVKGDLAGIKKAVAADRAKQVDDPDFKKMLPMIQAMEPKNVKITGGAIDGNTATLNATAKDGKETSKGTITMVLEGGVWKVKDESWESKSE